MVEYNCPKCFKKFNKKDDYNRHLNRKYSCVPMEEPMSKLERDTNEKLEAQQNLINELLKKIDNLSEKMEQLAITKNKQNLL